MPAVHDRGGQPGAGPIDRTEHAKADWEWRTHALFQVLHRKGLLTVDELRRSIESLPPEQYEAFSYYEKWASAIESLLVEKAAIAREAVDRLVADLDGAQAAPIASLPSRNGDDHEHEHDHEHPHAPIEETVSPAAARIRAIEAILIDQGVLTRDQVDRRVHTLRSKTPADGARLVARAWVDSEFKARLLADPIAAAAELGVDARGNDLVVKENTADVHHLVVCTLCSCYPSTVLGLPPDWYKSLSYRSRAVVDPRGVLREFGVELPEQVEVCVLDSTADLRYLVLPRRPEDTEGLSEAVLAQLVTRDSMIGAGEPLTPARR